MWGRRVVERWLGVWGLRRPGAQWAFPAKVCPEGQADSLLVPTGGVLLAVLS